MRQGGLRVSASRPRRRPLAGPALGFLGALFLTVGVAVGVAAVTPVAAGVGLSIPGCTHFPTQIAPGDSGSCQITFREPQSRGNAPAYAALSVSTDSHASGTQLGVGLGTEALLDGQTASGLQVSLSNVYSGERYGIGTVLCDAAYPNANYCRSSDRDQLLTKGTVHQGYAAVIQVKWHLPLQSGNAYQGGAATVLLSATFSGKCPTPSPSPSGGSSPSPSPSWTASPTGSPSGAPTSICTPCPTPTGTPSGGKSPSPTSSVSPTPHPTPSSTATPQPSASESLTPKPSASWSSSPKPTPKHSPCATPTGSPSGAPTSGNSPSPSPSVTPTGGGLGASTSSPSPSGTPAGGVLAAHTPDTGADLDLGLSAVLVALGFGIGLAGLWVWRRDRSLHRS